MKWWYWSWTDFISINQIFSSCVSAAWCQTWWCLTPSSTWTPSCPPSPPSWRRSQTTGPETWTCWSGLSVWSCTTRSSSLMSAGQCDSPSQIKEFNLNQSKCWIRQEQSLMRITSWTGDAQMRLPCFIYHVKDQAGEYWSYIHAYNIY